MAVACVVLLLYALFAPAPLRAASEARSGPTLDDLAFMVGVWRGETSNGSYEEIWTAPEAGCISGLFRLVSNGRLQVHEFMLIEPGDDGALELRLRHFGARMRPWEEEPLVFRLIELDEQRAVFELRAGEVVKTLRYEAHGEDRLVVTLTEPGDDGDRREARFDYRRGSLP